MTLAIQEPTDSGCCDVASSAVDDGSSLVTLYPRRTWESKWWWYYATITGTNGRTMNLDIAVADARNGISLTFRNGFWSYSADGPWHNWDSVGTQTSPDRIRFTKSSAFDQDTIHVAYYPVLSWGQTEALVETWKESEFVFPTISGDADLIVGTVAEDTTSFGRTCPAANLYGFMITDSAAVGPKNKGLLVSGVHPGETPGSHGLNAAVEFLLSDDPLAVILRTYWEWYIYPNVNPQGRYGGLYRNSPDVGVNVDWNRIWGGGTSDVVDDWRTVIDADTEGEINFYCDFHCYNFDYGGGSDFLDTALQWQPTGLKNAEFASLYVANYDSAFNWISWGGGITGTTAQWVEANLDNAGSLKVSMTSESQSRAAATLADYQLFGERIVKACADSTVSGGIFPVQAEADEGDPIRREARIGYKRVA